LLDDVDLDGSLDLDALLLEPGDCRLDPFAPEFEAGPLSSVAHLSHVEDDRNFWLSCRTDA
jgi:hypothetical protein